MVGLWYADAAPARTWMSWPLRREAIPICRRPRGRHLVSFRGDGAARGAGGPVPGADPFPDLQAMDGDIVISLKAQSHLAVANLEHRYREQGLAAAGAADDHRFLAFPRQDQHD